ncbi:glycerate kinase [Nesterenkonia cremea]|uniref:Glycerate kinase n=2 Tax=Nesterenkonia cremea TaxID=1882340 RepID=A0A917AUL1_9MICC|nr:glycerate kinase [Nesterenkonia cremea]
MAEGARRAGASAGIEVQTETLPFADGGEGTLDAICSAWGVQPQQVSTTDALGREVQARYAVHSVEGAVTAVIEAAEANGLPTVSDVPLQPLRATTYGVGALVSAAVEAGCEEVLLCIGGSATTDGGAGLLQALGARLLDSSGEQIGPGGGALADLSRIDTEDLDPRVRGLRWRIACDVINPLLGPEGAAAVFGPQKGADPQDVEELDAALGDFADVLAAQTGQDVRETPGMGAAGGLPMALVSLFDAEIAPGGELVAEVLGVQQVVTEAEIVLTGEGRLDSQSLGGKVVDTVRRLTPDQTPVFVLAGAVQISAAELDAAGLTAALSIARGPETLEELSAEAEARISSAAEQLIRTYLSGRAAAG